MYNIIIKNLLPILLLLYFVLGRFPTISPNTRQPVYPIKENYNCIGHIIKFFLYASLSVFLYFIDVKTLMNVTDHNKEVIGTIVLLTYCISIFEALDNITNFYFIKKSLYNNNVPNKLDKFIGFVICIFCLIILISSIIKAYY